ncbi:hypothetical protein V1507DRAFT_469543 [Lipomyces tetrasporus]
MKQPIDDQSTYKEGQLLLAKFAIGQGQIQSNRAAAATYLVPESTLESLHDATVSPNQQRLQNLRN